MKTKHEPIKSGVQITDGQYREYIRAEWPQFSVLGVYENLRAPLLHYCKTHDKKFFVSKYTLNRAKRGVCNAGCDLCLSKAKSTNARNTRMTETELVKALHERFAVKSPKLVKFSGAACGVSKFSCQSCGVSFTAKPINLLKSAFPCSCYRTKTNVEHGFTRSQQDTIKGLYCNSLLTTEQIAALIDSSSSGVYNFLVKSGLTADLKVDRGDIRRGSSYDLFDKYRSVVNAVTSLAYRSYADLLDPNGIRSDDFHLDHRLSAADAYKKRLGVELVSHPANLKVIRAHDNRVKSGKSTLTVTALKKRIKLFEAKHGRFHVPPHMLERWSFAEAPDLKGGLRVMSCDPGTSNFAWSASTIYGADAAKSCKMHGFGMVVNTVCDLTCDVVGQIRKFGDEIESLVQRYDPQVIIIERFQSRGLGGTTIERISMMLGAIAAATVPRGIVVVFTTAASWKNAFNRHLKLDDVYKRLPASKHHVFDAMMIGLYAFPSKDNVYKMLTAKKLDSIIAKIKEQV